MNDSQSTVKQVLKVGALYFATVFAVGFVLGTIRTLWLVPRLGARVAELIEAPVMLVVVVLAARTFVRRHGELTRWTQWIGVGLFGLGLLLVTATNRGYLPRIESRKFLNT